MATESEQVRILRESELLQTEIERLKATLESIVGRATGGGFKLRTPYWYIEVARAALAAPAREGDADADPA